MKKKILGLIVIIFTIIITTGCENKTLKEKKDLIKVENITDYVVKLPTYKIFDDEKAIDLIAKRFDGWTYEKTVSTLGEQGGCTALAKVMQNGDMVVSRNMDLTNSFTPEYVFYMDVPGKYKSFNVGYMASLGDNYQNTIKNGAEKLIYEVMPYLVTDAFNEHGLSIEVNMRNDEYDKTGNLILTSSGTNPNAHLRISQMSVARYLSDNAKDVNEALSLLGAVNYKTKQSYGEGKVDIYSFNSDTNKYNFAYMLADASGNYGVVEIVDNQVIFYPNQAYQANYYLGKEFRDKESYGSGYGRIETIIKDYDEINNIYDMMSTMSKVKYSNTYTYEKSPFDTRSELTGMNIFNLINIMKAKAKDYNFTLPDYSKLTQTMYDKNAKQIIKVNYETYQNQQNLTSAWTTKFLLNDANKEEVDTFRKWLSELYSSLTNNQLRQISLFWSTVHQITYNNTQKYAIVSFYEDENTTRIFNFDDID